MTDSFRDILLTRMRTCRRELRRARMNMSHWSNELKATERELAREKQPELYNFSNFHEEYREDSA